MAGQGKKFVINSNEKTTYIQSYTGKYIGLIGSTERVCACGYSQGLEWLLISLLISD